MNRAFMFLVILVIAGAALADDAAAARAAARAAVQAAIAASEEPAALPVANAATAVATRKRMAEMDRGALLRAATDAVKASHAATSAGRYAAPDDPVAAFVGDYIAGKVRHGGPFRLAPTLWSYPAMKPEDREIVMARVELMRAILSGERFWPEKMAHLVHLGGKFAPDEDELAVLAGPVRLGHPDAKLVEKTSRAVWRAFVPGATEWHWGADLAEKFIISDRLARRFFDFE